MQTSQYFGKFSTNAVITLRQIAQTPVAQLFGIVYLKIDLKHEISSESEINKNNLFR